MGARPYALIRTQDQWLRATHPGRLTAWNGELRAVELASTPRGARAPQVLDAPPLGGGLAFDAGCRAYRSRPELGRVERTRDTGAEQPEATALFAAPQPVPAGDFRAAEPAGDRALETPRGLAIDADDRLFVAEAGAARIVVVDLWSERVLRVVRTAGEGGAPAAPLDVACGRRRAYAVLDGPPWLVALEARRGPWPVPFERPAGVPAAALPRRVAAFGSAPPVVLFRHPGDDRAWVAVPGRARALAARGATDVELLSPDRLVVAHRPGEAFSQWDLAQVDAGARALRARGYDGLAIARAPDGRVAYGTATGIRRAVPARLRYERRGRVATYRLDSGELQNQWGRVFLDACVPEGCDVRLRLTTADDESDEPPAPRELPRNVPDLDELFHLDRTPPLEPRSLVAGAEPLAQRVHRRATGRELPWSRNAPGDPFETYEAPVAAPAGRFLWVTLELHGDAALTPRVRALRAEHATHDLLRRLPRVYSREPAVASFLRRYLAIVDGVAAELDARSDARATLLDPRSAPEELLPWLASFVGLMLDERWPVAARRTLVAEAPELFRLRGTVASLERLLEIYVGRRPLIVEHFRLRGMGGMLVGGSEGGAYTGALVGAGLRVGGAIGVEGETPLTGGPAAAFERHAHRFTVVIPAALGAEQLATVRDALDRHRPAHTVFDVCTVGSGMRVGRGLHVGLLSTVGRTGGWGALQAGGSLLGRRATVGRPVTGARVGESRIGGGVGPEVRVG